jgi:long-chain acyl-CoA synthetase
MTQISQFVRRAVQTGAGKVATVFGDRQRTWREFDERVRRLAGAMHGLGFKPGDRIGILALNCDRYLECLFGLSLGGFVFVPINTRLAPPEIVFWLGDSGCSALFVDEAFVPVRSWLITKHYWRGHFHSPARSVPTTIWRGYFILAARPAGPRA